MQVPGATGVGGRPFFTRKVTTLSDAILLENTSQGYSYSFAYEVRRPFKNGLSRAKGSYWYGVAKSIMDGTSDQAASNWGFVYVPGNANDAPLARSNFDPGHRITLTGSYDMPFAKVDQARRVNLLLGAVGPAVHAGHQRRCERRQSHRQRSPLHPDLVRQPDLYRRDVSEIFINWINGDDCLATVRRPDQFA